ncbi:hypothetical protein BTN49_1708 [Candidatus Enterovibrio escicola]|uniref:Uncharacterized protein n=1 Tax=Candidatus Enterovibrio escicola TaxID=1927127 RepID=A0A2A5T3Q1_9GAMM|nr:hypothetical protein BTN49_1708 [Candidatus Enterovibrio escacola]
MINTLIFPTPTNTYFNINALFTFEGLYKIHAILIDNKPYFVAKDVAKALGDG